MSRHPSSDTEVDRRLSEQGVLDDWFGWLRSQHVCELVSWIETAGGEGRLKGLCYKDVTFVMKDSSAGPLEHSRDDRISSNISNTLAK